MDAREKIESMVTEYRRLHPDFHYPPEEYCHPSVLAMHNEIQPWIVHSLGGPWHYWLLMLEAAKAWFPDKAETKLGRLFCVRLEIEYATFWQGKPEFEAILKDYAKWRGRV